MGIVYLIQPAECNGLSRFKVGCSERNDLSRLNAYKKGSVVICVFGNIQNPRRVESEVIRIFNDKFHNAAGREYFDGDIRQMESMFVHTVAIWKENMDILNISNDIPKDISNDIPKDIPTDIPKVIPKDIHNDIPNQRVSTYDWVKNNYVLYDKDVVKDFNLIKSDGDIYRCNWDKVGRYAVRFDIMYKQYKNDGGEDTATKFGRELTKQNVFSARKKVKGNVVNFRVGLMTPMISWYEHFIQHEMNMEIQYIKSSDLYAMYEMYCEQNNIKHMFASLTSFVIHLKDHIPFWDESNTQPNDNAGIMLAFSSESESSNYYQIDRKSALHWLSKSHRNDQDPVQRFIETRYIRTDNAKDRVSSQDLFNAFRTSDFYCPTINKQNFPEHLFRLNLNKIRISGVFLWTNLKINLC